MKPVKLSVSATKLYIGNCANLAGCIFKWQFRSHVATAGVSFVTKRFETFKYSTKY